MIFGSTNDIRLLTHISREVVEDVIEQEVLCYKMDLQSSKPNLYGESIDRNYYTPVKLNCLITRGDQAFSMKDYGPDLGREASFAFIKEMLMEIPILIEIGDIIEWHNSFYEVDAVKENQLFVGKDAQYNLENPNFGISFSIIADCHMTRGDRVGITQIR